MATCSKPNIKFCVHILAIETLQNHFILDIFIFISLFGENSPAKKRASRLLTIVINLVGPVATLMLGT
jgi:hypothetical protein